MGIRIEQIENLSQYIQSLVSGTTNTYVPFTGANMSVNLNTQMLTAGSYWTSHSNAVVLTSSTFAQNQTTNSLILEINNLTATSTLMGSLEFNIFRYTGLNYKFVISTYIYQSAWLQPSVSWVGGNSLEISKIEFLKHSTTNGKYYIRITFSTSLSYGSATVSYNGSNNFNISSGDYKLYRDTDPTLDLTNTTVSNTIANVSFIRDSYALNYNNLTNTPAITRIRSNTNAYLSGDITLTAGTNTSLTQSGNIITVSSANTTYTAGNGLTLTGTAFSLPVTQSGSGNVVSDVTSSATGITVTKGLTAMLTSHAANAITTTNINNWDNAFGWGNHDGLYVKKNGDTMTGALYFSSDASTGIKRDINGLTTGTWSRLIYNVSGSNSFNHGHYGVGNSISYSYFGANYDHSLIKFSNTNMNIGYRAADAILRTNAVLSIGDATARTLSNTYAHFKDNAILQIAGQSGVYGMNFGVDSSTGTGWIQGIRTDSTVTTYNLALNPNSGQVSIGYLTTLQMGAHKLGVDGSIMFSGGTSSGILNYGGNYHSTYTSRSLVDKEYVDTLVSTSAITQTRLRANASAYLGGDITLSAGANTILTQSGNVITMSGTPNTTYTAGSGLTLTSTAFSLPVTTTGTGTFVQSVAQNANGLTVTMGTPTSTTSATQLATPRTIALGTGVVGTATSFDGTENITIPVTSVSEAYLTWGGRNLSSNFSPLDASMIPELGANRLAFMPVGGVTLEYSRDGGTTWVSFGSEAIKINLFNGVGSSIQVGGGGYAAGVDYTDYKVRATIDTSIANVYTALNKFVILLSTNGSTGSYCRIRAKTHTNFTNSVDTWTTFASNVGIGGWSGYSIININPMTTYGNSGGQFRIIELEFGQTGYSTTYTGLQIFKILGYGGVGWTTPSTLARTGNMFTYDYLKNVTFDNNVTAVGFIKSSSSNSYVLLGGGSHKLISEFSEVTTRLRANTSAYIDGDITLTAGANVSLTQNGNVITISGTPNTNTTYTAGNGITLSGTQFSVPVVQSGSGGIVTSVVSSATGITVTKGDISWADISGTPTLANEFSLRSNANAYLTGAVTLSAGGNTTLTQSGNVITISGTPNTTYSAGSGLTLSSTTFSLPITLSGSGTYVQSVAQNANGLTVTMGTPPNTDTNTTYTAGNGLTLTGTVFSLPVTQSGTGDFVKSVVSSSTGITVTKGDVPANSLVTSSASTGVTNVATTNTNTFLNIVRDGESLGSSTQISGAGGTIITSDAAGKITVSSTPNTNTTYTAGNGLTLSGTQFSVPVTTTGTGNVVDSVVSSATGISVTKNTIAMTTLHAAYNITSTNITNWNSAFGWGDHNGLYPSRATLNATINSIRVLDTRDSDLLPSTNLKSGAWFDFKRTTAISLTGLGQSTYASTITLVPYSDDSGNTNTAFMLAQSANNLFFKNYGTGSWGAWNKLITHNNIGDYISASTYTAGSGLTLTGTAFSLPVTLSGSGTYVQSVAQNANGLTVTMGTPPNTAYTAGNGLTLSGTVFSLPVTTTGTGNVVSTVVSSATGISVTKGLTAMLTSHAANAITSTNITNWNNAFGWGNHDGLYVKTSYLQTRQIATTAAANTKGFDVYHVPSSATDKPTGVTDGSLISSSYSNIWTNQMFSDWRANDIYIRNQNNGTWGTWEKLYHSGNFATGTTAQYIRGDGSLATLPTSTSTRLRANTSAYIDGDITLTAGANVSLTQSGNVITISGTPNTTYTAGNGITLSGTQFSVPISNSGTGNTVISVTQNTNGLTASYADRMPLFTNRPTQDLNTLRLSGIYGGGGGTNETTNRPTNGYDYSPYIVLQSGSDRFAQIWVDAWSGNNNNDTIHYRSGSNTQWGTWQKMWHSGNLTKLSQLTNDVGFVTSSSAYTAGNGLTLTGTQFSLPVTISGSGTAVTSISQNTNGLSVTMGNLYSTRIGVNGTNYTSGDINFVGSGSTTVVKSGNVVYIGSTSGGGGSTTNTNHYNINSAVSPQVQGQFVGEYEYLNDTPEYDNFYNQIGVTIHSNNEGWLKIGKTDYFGNPVGVIPLQYDPAMVIHNGYIAINDDIGSTYRDHFLTILWTNSGGQLQWMNPFEYIQYKMDNIINMVGYLTKVGKVIYDINYGYLFYVNPHMG